MIFNEITVGANELWKSLLAIMPILGVIILLIFITIFILWLHKKIVISNHFYDCIDKAAAAEIKLLSKQNQDKDKEILLKTEKIESLESCIQRIIEIGIRS